MASHERPSKTSVRKAGSKIRKFRSGEASQAEFEEALETVRVFRSQFAGPLLRVTNSVSGIASGSGIDAQVTQRLKREQTIVEKLGDREKGLDLSRMQDIGGCRILVSDIAEVRTVEAAILDAWGVQVADTGDHPVQILARNLAEIYRLEEEQKRVPLDLITIANDQIAEVNKLLTASIEKQEGAS